jgi:hypothetical protein
MAAAAKSSQSETFACIPNSSNCGTARTHPSRCAARMIAAGMEQGIIVPPEYKVRASF